MFRIISTNSSQAYVSGSLHFSFLTRLTEGWSCRRKPDTYDHPGVGWYKEEWKREYSWGPVYWHQITPASWGANLGTDLLSLVTSDRTWGNGVIISEGKTDLKGTISMLKQNIRTQIHIERLVEKHEKKKIKYNLKSRNTMLEQEEYKNIIFRWR